MSRKDYDVIIIGGGPSGLFTAIELSASKLKTALFEKGSCIKDSICPSIRNRITRHFAEVEQERNNCQLCTCLEGLGGAAFHFDINLGYVNKLSRSKINLDGGNRAKTYSKLETAVGGYDLANRLVNHVFEIFKEYGLKHDVSAHLHDESFPIPNDIRTYVDMEESVLIPLNEVIKLVDRFTKRLTDNGVDICLNSKVQRVFPGSKRRWCISYYNNKSIQVEAEADYIVFAVGKVALPWLIRSTQDIGISYLPAKTVEVGLRLESLKEDLQPLTAKSINPKHSILLSKSQIVRTFCVCPSGRLMQYKLVDTIVLDGQHCVSRKGKNTNFGILTTIKLEEDIDGTEYALDFAREVNRLGSGGPVIQTLRDFQERKATQDISLNQVDTSLKRYVCGDLNQCLPSYVANNTLELISYLNDLYPNIIQPYSILAAPIVESIMPDFQLTHEFESTANGIFLAGDCSGKLMGVIFGGASGIQIANAILNKRGYVYE